MPGGNDKRGLGKGEQRNKVVSLAEAAALVRSGDTVCTSGFVGIGTPDDLLAGLEQRFLDDRRAAQPDAAVRGGAGGRQGAGAQPARA